MNIIFFLIILAAYLTSAWQMFSTTSTGELNALDALTQTIFTTSQDAVMLAIGLIGVMAFFLGLMKVAEEAGLLQAIAKLLHPVLKLLFPNIPAGHPAMGAMVMNISANMLGLGNAATPFGIKAMQELNKLNANPLVATNAMVLFLAINTSSVTLIPTKVLALRTAAGSTDPSSIIVTTLFATICSTIVAILAAKGLARFFKEEKIQIQDYQADAFTPYPSWLSFSAMGVFFASIPLIILYGQAIAPWIVPTLVVFILSLGVFQKINIYEVFAQGAKEGFEVAIKIIPYLVAILAAIAMFRESGALHTCIGFISPITAPFGLPADALPMALIRPLSGSGALGVMADTMNNPAIGPDSYTGLLVSTMMGSTETTFYVIAVYFGAIQVKKFRHAIPAALLADLTGIIASVFIVHQFFG